MSLLGIAAAGGCSTPVQGTPTTPSQLHAPAAPPGASLDEATVIPLSALRADPSSYEWFQFKPGVKKLILSGAPDGRHVAVLWYGYEGKPGLVPLHYHAKTESIFVIDGAQSDPKGVYEKGSFYFNPPGSGHNIFDSAGLFLLSYAAPADFTRTAEIGPYAPVVIHADYAQRTLAPCADGSLCEQLPLAADGGISSRFVKPQAESVAVTANVLLLLQGSCVVAGQALSADTLIVTKSTEPATYQVASPSQDCLLFELAFI